MKPYDKSSYFTWHNGVLTPLYRKVVSESPLQLIVNGQEIATLIGSPHSLGYLAAGFLRLQGFVSSVDDFELFGVCEDFGIANIRIKGTLPEKLKPVLTSGCGTGISFSLPANSISSNKRNLAAVINPLDIFTLMDKLSKKSANYQNHGGIHSAAIGNKGELILYAEDLGRHNTLDRIAGEALFKGIDVNNTMLITSGRISTEMVAKTSMLGICLIASRTSPTDMAVKLCEECGICLCGYVRGDKFTVYAHSEMLEISSDTRCSSFL